MTNNLKREIPYVDNQLENIPVPQTVGFVEIDLTKKPQDYERMLDALSQRFDNQFLPMAIAADQRRIVAKAKRETAQAAKNAEIPEPNLLLMYAHALASNDPLAKNEFLEGQTNENLNPVLKEISEKPRHYNSVFNYQVGYAIETLRYHIATHPAQKPSFVERVKNAIGVLH